MMRSPEELPNGVQMPLDCPWCGADLTDLCGGRWSEFEDTLSEHVQTCAEWLRENAER